SPHDPLRAHANAAVKIHHVLVGETEAARRHRLADRLRLVGSMDAEQGRAEIHGARTEWILWPTPHEAWQVGAAPQHLCRWSPAGPFLLRRDACHAGPGKADAADP